VGATDGGDVEELFEGFIMMSHCRSGLIISVRRSWIDCASCTMRRMRILRRWICCVGTEFGTWSGYWRHRREVVSKSVDGVMGGGVAIVTG
jgi:hypothetical protein